MLPGQTQVLADHPLHILYCATVFKLLTPPDLTTSDACDTRRRTEIKPSWNKRTLKCFLYADARHSRPLYFRTGSRCLRYMCGLDAARHGLPDGPHDRSNNLPLVLLEAEAIVQPGILVRWIIRNQVPKFVNHVACSLDASTTHVQEVVVLHSNTVTKMP